MAKKKENRGLVVMLCSVCSHTSKTTERNKQNDPKLELSVYCSHCRKHTTHKSKDAK